ncbi:MAG: nuclear transport factor 2 family protein [Chitinophagaceae bacterium]|nr:nuclear transport factor 2 family protein [Chitinophagaceae bacterium]
MKKILIMSAACMLLLACNNEKKDDTKTGETTVSSADGKTPQQSEFADPKYADWGKKMIASMAAGDIDGWMAGYADNAVYQWSAGDSLAGKEAISKYWKERRANVIDSISFSNDIWLPIKVNTPQKGPDVPGVWLLSWYQVNVKYKNGKKLSFWTHTDHHFDANDKVDRSIQYIDRAPINAAVGGK